MIRPPIVKDVVLLGGGHAHALLLAQWAMAPMPGVRLTLVSPDAHTPYSGMLPGLLAGHYDFDDSHIDLDRLCAVTGTRFIRAAASGIDIAHKQVNFADRPALAFDWLSVNVGGAPRPDIPGSHYATPVKPIQQLYHRWQAMRASLAEKPKARIAIAGGGAAAVELACALRAQAVQADIALYFPEPAPLEGYNAGFRRRAARALGERNIRLQPGSTLTSIDTDRFATAEGDEADYDFLLLSTPVRPPRWLAESGIATDDQGFMQVNDRLQSPQLPWLFGAGDCVSLVGQPRPKAGVYAVRQAPVLLHNLRAALVGEALRPFRAQRQFLSLLSLGDGRALATRAGGWMPTLEGRWVWRWKDRIDRRFMAMFSSLQPAMSTPSAPQSVDPRLWDGPPPAASALAMRCGGCGAKVPGDLLQQALAELDTCQQPGVLIGLDDPDDAAALQLPDGATLVQSVDQFRALTDDHWLQGRLGAQHALSDLYAMHARPHSAQALVTLPFAADAITRRDLGQLMQGALSVLNPAGCQLTGGHTGEGAELSLGFAVNGLDQGRLMTKAGLQPGDYLILTKPLGTGCLFAARARGQARGRWISAALATMQLGNGDAARILYEGGAHACTDITGFGLAGHLAEMLRASHLSARLDPARVPVYEGALAVLAQGWVSSLYDHNLRLRTILRTEQLLEDTAVRLWFDPQTGGGLLAGIAPAHAHAVCEALQLAGYPAAIVGKVLPAQDWLLETGNFGQGPAV